MIAFARRRDQSIAHISKTSGSFHRVKPSGYRSLTVRTAPLAQPPRPSTTGVDLKVENREWRKRTEQSDQENEILRRRATASFGAAAQEIEDSAAVHGMRGPSRRSRASGRGASRRAGGW